MTVFLAGHLMTAPELSQGGIIARGRRGTTSSTTTSEVGVLRIDGVVVRQGRLYEIGTTPLATISTVAGDHSGARVRYSTSGLATTASTVLMTSVGYTSSAANTTPTIWAKFIPGADQTLSLILTVVRIAGTGTVSILINSGSPDIEIWIRDAGTDPGDTGVIL